jgi:hypothetical protein
MSPMTQRKKKNKNKNKKREKTNPRTKECTHRWYLVSPTLGTPTSGKMTSLDHICHDKNMPQSFNEHEESCLQVNTNSQIPFSKGKHCSNFAEEVIKWPLSNGESYFLSLSPLFSFFPRGKSDLRRLI